MTSRQPPLLRTDEEATRSLMALRLGTWLTNGHRAYRLVRRFPGSGELELEDASSRFRTTPDHILRAGYRPVKRKPRQARGALEAPVAPG